MDGLHSTVTDSVATSDVKTYLESSTYFTDVIKIAPYNQAMVTYYFDSRNIPFFEVKYSFTAAHEDIS